MVINNPRTLTTIVNVATGISANSSIAVGILLDLRPTAPNMRQLYIVDQNAQINVSIGVYDGTTFTGVNFAVAFPITTLLGGGILGPAVKNGATGTLNYVYAGWDWK
jgi:hypothetical protein